MWQKILHKWLKAPFILHTVQYHTPKHYDATVILLHGIGSSTAMWADVAARTPKRTRVIALDLLGFGRSPKPDWNTYSARMQADSIATTLFSMRITGPVVIVGHSLGALVAIEFARRYPIMTKSLVLVSPPLYHPDHQAKRLGYRPEQAIRQAYALMRERPTDTERILRLASKYNLVNRGFVVDNVNVPAYLATLDSIIINQTSYADIMNIKRPIHIISGALDMLVLDSTLRAITKAQPNVTWKRIAGGHEIFGLMLTAVNRAIDIAIAEAIAPKAKN